MPESPLARPLRDAIHWAIAGKIMGLKQIDAMIEAAATIDRLDTTRRCRKNKLATEGQAKATLHRLSNRDGTSKAKRIYYREICKAWHITSQPA